MGRFDAATIAFGFLIIGGLGIVMFFSSPMIGSILLFGAFFILLYGWLEMTADIRDSLIDLNKRIAEMETPGKIGEQRAFPRYRMSARRSRMQWTGS